MYMDIGALSTKPFRYETQTGHCPMLMAFTNGNEANSNSEKQHRTMHTALVNVNISDNIQGNIGEYIGRQL